MRPLLLTTAAFLPLSAQAAGLDLAQAIREATSSGPEAQVLKNTVDSADQKVRSVKSVAWPKVSAYANAGLGQSPNATAAALGSAFGALGQSIGNVNKSANGPGSNLDPLAALASTSNDDPYYNYAWGVQVQQALFTFGKVSTALRMARTQERITRASSLSTRLSIQSDVVDLYMSAVLAKAKADVARRSVSSQDEVVSSLERNFQLGSGTKAQVLLARSRRISLQQDIIAADRDARAARQAFNRILGRPADDSVPLDTAGLSDFEKQPAELSQILSAAQGKRQDLRTLRESRTLMEDLAFIDKAAYYPTVGLQGKFGFQVADQAASSVKHAADWAQRDWSIGVGLTWTIFDGWDNAGQEGEVRAQLRTLGVREGDMVRGIAINADTYLHDKQAADSALAAATEGVAAAREARDLYHLTLTSGGGSLSDLLSAEDNLRSAEFAWLAARLARAKACIHLTLVQGDDLIALPEAP